MERISNDARQCLLLHEKFSDNDIFYVNKSWKRQTKGAGRRGLWNSIWKCAETNLIHPRILLVRFFHERLARENLINVKPEKNRIPCQSNNHIYSNRPFRYVLC